MLDLLNLLVQATLMIILAMSPFFIGFGILFYSVYFFTNGKHKDLMETVYWKIVRIKNKRKELKEKQEKIAIEKAAIEKGNFEIIKVNGRLVVKTGEEN